MGSLESEVLAALWASGEPLTPSQVVDTLGSGLAYTTIVTVLTRLVDKGVVRRDPKGRTFQYTPLVSEGALTASRMRAALEGAHDRVDVLSHFASALTASEARALRTFLDRGGKK